MVVGEVRIVELVCVMGKPMISWIKMSLELVYGEWRERCPRLAVIWWETPLSRNNDRCVMATVVVVATLTCGCLGVGGVKVEAKEGVNCIVVDWKEGQRFALWSWMPYC